MNKISQKASKGLGVCGVCWGSFKTHASDGTIHRHGPRSKPCSGSDQPPLDTLTPTRVAQIGLDTTNADISSDTNSSPSINSAPPKSDCADNITNSGYKLSHPVNVGSLIKRIPQAARPACAELLSRLLRAVVESPHSATNWSDLLSFGYNVLAVPKRGGNKRSLVKLIQGRVASWTSSVDSSTNDRTNAQRRQPVRITRRSSEEAEQYLAKAVSSKLEEGNIKAAIRLACSEDKPAPNTAETLSALKKKHPPAATDRRPACSPDSARFDPLQMFDAEIISRMIRSFPVGSAGGPDGITPQHLKDLTSPSVTGDLATVITDFVNFLLEGDLPDSVREIIFGGNLIALQK